MNYIVTLRNFLVQLVCYVLKYVAWLAVECLTNGLQGGEADGLGLARLQDGEVGLGDADFLGQFL